MGANFKKLSTLNNYLTLQGKNFFKTNPVLSAIYLITIENVTGNPHLASLQYTVYCVNSAYCVFATDPIFRNLRTLN
jgi:hypothetical protein